MPSCSRGAERVRHTTDTIYEDGNFRVSKVAGKGYGMLAARRFEAGALVLQVRYAGECVRVRRAPQGVMCLSTFSCARARVRLCRRRRLPGSTKTRTSSHQPTPRPPSCCSACTASLPLALLTPATKGVSTNMNASRSDPMIMSVHSAWRTYARI